MTEPTAAATTLTGDPDPRVPPPSHVTQDIRARAVAAAKAARAAADAPAAAPPPAPPEAAPPEEPTSPDAPPPSPDAEPAPPVEASPADDLHAKIAKRTAEQRIRESIAAKYRAQEAELHQRQQQLAAHEEDLKLARRIRELREKGDHVALAKEVGVDNRAYIEGVLHAGKPEEKISQNERMWQEERKARLDLEARLEARDQAERKVQSEREFAALALDEKKFPTLAAVYSGSDPDLFARAYEVQALYVKQHNKPPTLAEIAHNMERVERAKAERYRKVPAPPPPPEKAKAATPKLTPSAGAETSGKPDAATLTDDQRRRNAIAAAKKLAGKTR